MAKEKAAPASAEAPAPDLPPPTSGGAFERLPGGELKPIEESAERQKRTEPPAPPPAPTEANV